MPTRLLDYTLDDSTVSNPDGSFEGARLKLSSVLSQRSLGVSRIDNLLGPSRDTRIITSSR